MTHQLALAAAAWFLALNLTEQRDDLLAFLRSLTDEALLHDPRFASPWKAAASFQENSQWH